MKTTLLTFVGFGLLFNPVLVTAESIPITSFVANQTTTDNVAFDENPSFGEQKPDIDVRVAKRTTAVVATAYSSDAAQTDSTPCIPAMSSFNLCDYYSVYGVEDTIAANFLALGTEVRFPDLYGSKVFVVRDRMNSKYNGRFRIDFWKKDRDSAVQFGAKRMKMEVL